MRRPDDSHAGQTSSADEPAFVFGMPIEDVVDHRNPAAIVHRAAKLYRPWTHPVRDTLQHPQANLSGALDRVFPAMDIVVDRHAGNTGDWFVVHHAAKYLRIPAGKPRRNN